MGHDKSHGNGDYPGWNLNKTAGDPVKRLPPEILDEKYGR